MCVYVSMCVLFACTFVYQMHAWCPQRPKKGVGTPRTVVSYVSHYVSAGSETWIL